MTFATHDEPNGSQPHRRVHPNKKRGLIKKLKVSRPMGGVTYTSPKEKSRPRSARFDMLEDLSNFRSSTS